LNPRAVRVRHAIAFAGEGFWFFLELLAGVNKHHASAMAGRIPARRRADDVSERRAS